jgi:hypothetical protein
LFFRACVALRRILAARRRPVVRRVRKAVLLAAITAGAVTGHAAEEAANSRGLDSHDSASLIDERIRPIGQLGTSIAQTAGELPINVAGQRFAQSPVFEGGLNGRDWLEYAYFWEAPALPYHPLYFEERMVERYGYRARYGLQPLISGAHFFAAVPALPVRMMLERPCTCVYPLGFVRPGSAIDCER